MITQADSPLILKIKRFFELNSGQYELNAATTVIKPILNWGGFVNSSFFISDSCKHFHLKLSSEPEVGLELFYKASNILNQRYHSPKANSWITIPDTEFRGILFEFIEGNTAGKFSVQNVKELHQILGRLHRDSDLKNMLGDEQLPCFQTYLDVYDNRFFEDLKLIAKDLPPFVTQATFDFMVNEAEKLKNFVTKAPEFEVLTDAPIHSDIWANNLLIDKNGNWFLIDWDGLKVGDSSLDYAMLLGPSQDNWERRSDPLEFDIRLLPESSSRIRLYHQAMLLDWVIDPLADWIEAEKHPEWADAVRTENEKNHSAALKCYRNLYVKG